MATKSEGVGLIVCATTVYCGCVFTAMPVSAPVTNSSVLREGDHIKWKRLAGYDHHAIVEKVDRVSGKVHIIEYGSTGRGIRVTRRVVHGTESMYKYVYDECDNANQVLQRAKSRLGERKYNPLTHNCEHFATQCKTGEENCSQIRPFAARVGTSVAEAGSGGLGTATGRVVATCARAAAKNGTTIFNEVKNVVTCGGAKDALKSVGNAVVNGGKKIGFNGLKSWCKFGVTGAVSAVTELGLFSYNLYKAQKNYKTAIQHAENEEMKQKFKQHRNNNIREAGLEAVGGVIGTVALGAAIGSVIPVVGTVIGAAVGSIGGHIGGRAIGRLLRK